MCLLRSRANRSPSKRKILRSLLRRLVILREPSPHTTMRKRVLRMLVKPLRARTADTLRLLKNLHFKKAIPSRSLGTRLPIGCTRTDGLKQFCKLR